VDSLDLQKNITHCIKLCHWLTSKFESVWRKVILAPVGTSIKLFRQTFCVKPTTCIRRSRGLLCLAMAQSKEQKNSIIWFRKVRGP
jgi:hypothetical protein